MLLDVNKIAEGKDFCIVSGINVSPDNKILAYGTDFVSRNRFTISFKNLQTGELLSDRIENTSGSVTWASDSKTCFYTSKNSETLRPEKIMKHKLGKTGISDKEVYYDYMLSYSPYDQVKEQEYPNMLVTTGFWDSQVQYWEPAKWVAKLRYMKTGDNILVLDCNMTGGHGGASVRFGRLRTTALEYAFMLDLAGMEK